MSLRAFHQLKSITPRRDWAVEARKRVVMRAQNELQHQPFARPGFAESWFLFARPLTSVAVFLLVIVTGMSIVKASKQSSPESMLFPVRVTSEKAQLALVSDAMRSQVAQKYAQNYFEMLKNRGGKNGFVEKHSEIVQEEVEKQIAGELDRVSQEVTALQGGSTKEAAGLLLTSARERMASGDMGSALQSALALQKLIDTAPIIQEEALKPQESHAPTVSERPLRPIRISKMEPSPKGFVADILFEPMDSNLE